MEYSRVHLAVSVIALLAFVYAGCGGGGDGSGSAAPQTSASVTSLEWDPPKVAADGTPMDSRRDLEFYEFYLRTDTNFTESDIPIAQVAACHDVISPNGKTFARELTKEFTLENLLPFTEKGKRYYVSIRAVGVDGLKSGFMVPVEWDLS
jgi:hypothetical protein